MYFIIIIFFEKLLRFDVLRIIFRFLILIKICILFYYIGCYDDYFIIIWYVFGIDLICFFFIIIMVIV